MGEACVARGIDDLHIRAYGGQLFGQGSAIHSGHHHVGEQQMNLAIVFFGDFDRFLRMFRFEYGVSAVGQKAAR